MQDVGRGGGPGREGAVKTLHGKKQNIDFAIYLESGWPVGFPRGGRPTAVGAGVAEAPPTGLNCSKVPRLGVVPFFPRFQSLRRGGLG